MNDGQYNGGYYEIMARVTKTDGTEVGYCFVERPAGVRQKVKRFNIINLVLNSEQLFCNEYEINSRKRRRNGQNHTGYRKH